MATSLAKENYLLHKLHSLSGVIPVGYYMVQHLVLNTFSIGGAAYFDGVIEFFEGMPKHFLLAIEIFGIWIPLVFHSVYGFMITARAKPNYVGTRYGWSQNRMYTLQRVSGIVIAAFLVVHFATTTGAKYVTGDPNVIKFAAWHAKLQNPLWLLFYLVGIAAASYHLGYGLWNFCIRWGITISERAQAKLQKISFAAFVGITLIGYAALAGFLINKPTVKPVETSPAVATLAP